MTIPNLYDIIKMNKNEIIFVIQIVVGELYEKNIIDIVYFISF